MTANKCSTTFINNPLGQARYDLVYRNGKLTSRLSGDEKPCGKTATVLVTWTVDRKRYSKQLCDSHKLRDTQLGTATQKPISTEVR